MDRDRWAPLHGASGCFTKKGGSDQGARGAGRRRTQSPSQRDQRLWPVPIEKLPKESTGTCGRGGGDHLPEVFQSSKMRLSLFWFTQHCKRFSPFLAASASLLLCQGQAKAVLTYSIFESNGDVIIQATGNLNLPSPIGTDQCEANGAIASVHAYICTGPNSLLNIYGITGPASFNGTVFNGDGTSTSSISTYIAGGPGQFLVGGFGISGGYISGDPIISSSTIAGQTLASLGFASSSGLLGSWTLDGTGDTIQAFLGPASPPSAVPGPLPLLGAGAAFGWSRRLRHRITQPLATPPQD